MSKNLAIAALILALASPAAYAGGILNLDADEQSYVFLDGDELGTTPLLVKDIEPGYHNVRIENPRTGQRKEFSFYSPRRTTVQKAFSVAWAAEPVPVAPQPVYVQQPPVVVQQAPPPAAPPKDNSKARMRNVMLGAGLVNEVFNNSRGKKTVRKGVVGAGLLNELLNK